MGGQTHLYEEYDQEYRSYVPHNFSTVEQHQSIGAARAVQRRLRSIVVVIMEVVVVHMVADTRAVRLRVAAAERYIIIQIHSRRHLPNEIKRPYYKTKVVYNERKERIDA